MNLIRKILCLLILVCLFAGGVAEQNADGSDPAKTPVMSEQFNSSYASESFQNMLKQHPDIQELIEKSIAQAAEINPDRETNPVQSLDELYGFLDYTVTCMP